MDFLDKHKRSEIMSRIRAKNTKPELILRKALHAEGFRFRIHYTKLPGKPDIALPRYKTAIRLSGEYPRAILYLFHESKKSTWGFSRNSPSRKSLQHLLIS